MNVHILGCRGSLPAPLTAHDVEDKILRALEQALTLGLDRNTDMKSFIRRELPFHVRSTYGGNTSCVEIRDNENFLLCDAGTGIREFGNTAMQTGRGSNTEFHILLSHPHWDHIQGFPFFIPAFVPGNTIVIHGCHDNLEEVFRTQNSAPSFPVDFADLSADIRFEKLTPGKTATIAGFDVQAMKQRHPGDSYAYRIEKKGKCAIYATDSEHKCDLKVQDNPATEFFRNADLLIFDAQYSYAEACSSKEDWGHSNNIVGVELAQTAGVKRLLLFHLEPAMNDKDLDIFLTDTRRYSELYGDTSQLQIDMAHDGMIIEL